MTSIGRYQIVGELGRGAMGIVYRARDSKIGREVAIKTIHLRELADDVERQRLRDRLFREAQSAGILSHPNIVTIYDVAEEGDLAYIAMELVNGPTLDQLMSSEPLEGKFVLSILSQTAAALDFAHKRGIVHRDIKPANIMIHEGTTAKITDFGVARLASHQMTQVGSMVGTPNYMSPEQIQTKPVDGRSDQFSLAVIAYELLTGEKPFAADSIAALAYKIVREPAVPVHRLNPTLDWPLDTVLQKALAKEPENRYPTCSDFVFALENACRSCKKWRPLRVGTAEDMATSFEAPAPVIAPAETPPKPKKASRNEATKTPTRENVITEPAPWRERVATPPPPPGTPLFLRVTRLLALMVIGGGLIAAMLVSAVRYLEDRNKPDTSQPAAQNSAPVEAPPAVEEPAPAKKPSAMPDLPGDRGANPSSQAETPEQSDADQASPAPAAPKPPSASHPEQPRSVHGAAGDIRLVTNPPGAQLEIDGSPALSCQTPCSLTLPNGRHTLAATMPGFRRTLRILETPRDNEVFLNLDRANGTVTVRSEPRGATIYVNGEARSDRTPAMLSLPVGNYTIDIVYDGQRESRQVQVRDSVITNVAVDFGR